MTHGATQRDPMPPLIHVYPGPVIKAWQDGVEVLCAPLSDNAAMYLAIQLLTAIRVRAPSNTPNENLPFEEHMARREAQRNPA